MAGSIEIVMAHGLWQFLSRSNSYVPINIGVYGAKESGKTTLDKQFTTKGEIQELGDKERTHHGKTWRGNHRLPHSTKKRIKSNGLMKTIVSRDIGGHHQYYPMWLRDMIERKVSTVVVVIDHRHMKNTNNTDNQLALGYLVESFSRKTVPKGLSLRARFRAKKYAPRRLILLANKADEWMDEECHAQWGKGFIARHKIFDVFREDLYKLQKMHIPVHIDAISARYGWNVEDSLLKGVQL
jgi:hypothetical protein